MQGESDLSDPWLRELFVEIAGHGRKVLLYLEEGRESLLESEG